MITISKNDLIETVRLRASGGANPEYDRALVELAADLLGLGPEYADDRESVETQILGRTIRAEEDYVYGVRYTDGTHRARGSRAAAESLISAQHGDVLVRMIRPATVVTASWEIVR